MGIELPSRLWFQITTYTLFRSWGDTGLCCTKQQHFLITSSRSIYPTPTSFFIPFLNFLLFNSSQKLPVSCVLSNENEGEEWEKNTTWGVGRKAEWQKAPKHPWPCPWFFKLMRCVFEEENKTTEGRKKEKQGTSSGAGRGCWSRDELVMCFLVFGEPAGFSTMPCG